MTRALIFLTSALSVAAVSATAEGLSARSNYVLRCSGCHGMDGTGTLEGGIPAFRNSVSNIARTDTGRTYLMHVPGVVSTGLNDGEIARVMNYVLETWGDGDGTFTQGEVSRRRAIPVEDVVALRRQVVRELRIEGTSVAEYPWP